MTDQLARLLLLILFAAVFVNVTRGTLRAWLRAKFIGAPGTAVAASSRPVTTSNVPGGVRAPIHQNPKQAAGVGGRPT